VRECGGENARAHVRERWRARVRERKHTQQLEREEEDERHTVSKKMRVCEREKARDRKVGIMT